MLAERHATSELAGFVAALRLERVPAAVVETAKRALMDSLGCGVFGAQMEWGRIVRDFAVDQGSRPVATLLADGARVSAGHAALANGTAIHGFELDDLINKDHVHPGAVIVSAALAAAEAAGASGERLIAGIIAGYEVMSRVGGALGNDQSVRGFHTTGIAGPVGAAAAAGVVRGLTAQQLANALGIAVAFSSGVKQFAQSEGGMIKRLHGGHAAESGVVAADLAARSFTAAQSPLEGHMGLLEVVGGAAARVEPLTASLGEDWALTHLWVKMYPCCALIHSTLQAIEKLRAEHHFAADDVARVRIGASKRLVDQNSNPAPADTVSAQYSVLYCAAIALAADPKDPRHYATDRLFDPEQRARMKLVESFVDPKVDAAYPKAFGAAVAIELRDGRTVSHEVLQPHGTEFDPAGTAEVEEKFRILVGGQSRVRADDVLDALRTIEGAPTLGALTDVLRRPGVTAP